MMQKKKQRQKRDIMKSKKGNVSSRAEGESIRLSSLEMTRRDVRRFLKIKPLVQPGGVE